MLAVLKRGMSSASSCSMRSTTCTKTPRHRNHQCPALEAVFFFFFLSLSLLAQNLVWRPGGREGRNFGRELKGPAAFVVVVRAEMVQCRLVERVPARQPYEQHRAKAFVLEESDRRWSGNPLHVWRTGYRPQRARRCCETHVHHTRAGTRTAWPPQRSRNRAAPHATGRS